MEDKILDIMRSVFNRPDIDNTVSQSNCAEWDSLRHLSLIIELENTFGTEFEPEEIAAMKTFSDVLAALSRR